MKKYLSVNKQAYNTLAKQYAARLPEYEQRDTELIGPFIEYLNGKFKEVKILELGPGSGLALRFFEKAGFGTTAIEIAEEIINNAQVISPKTTFINDDFLTHNFMDQKYQGIFAKAFIHLFPKVDAQAVIVKIHDLLSPNGAFFITTTLHSKPMEGYKGKADYSDSPPRFRKRWTEMELMESLGNKWKIMDKNYNQERGKNWIALTLVKK